MTFSYDFTDLATNDVMQVRFELGDTVSDDRLFENEEIEYAIARFDSRTESLAYLARAAIIKLLREPQKYSVGGLSVDYGTRLTQWQKRLEMYEEDDVGGFVLPIATAYNTTPLVLPYFTSDLHDYTLDNEFPRASPAADNT
jgi:hypothetical protein